ncbi:hypothetical protein BL253_34270 [Pseudofrankia asymbiotica]|uniref:CoA transferase n=1 Tax=Pseudofrankia asymbiotica TaxID=1834516 RepID=A0A1V2I1C8_9ACTN|nr:CoA transferase [Pseudofrankia asymbiotica]ONH22936.1 hypothetical protein BL253_34270 [Pseudofrankia asymbiotica]
MGGPLDGVKVVELGVVVAGPACAGILLDWGAEVVKVEPPEGDPHRGNTITALFELDNRGKRSVCLDLKNEAAREVLLQLLAGADVLVTNLRLAALARLGLDYETLSARFPRLVYAAATGYGVTGARSGRGQARVRHGRLLVARGNRVRAHPGGNAAAGLPAGPG